MFVIGLIGGIGSGKSSVSEILKSLGVDVIDADKVGHEAYTPDSEGWRKVISVFGQDIVGPDKQIDRKKLGSIVFSDPNEMDKLNKLMHPIIHDLVKEKIKNFSDQGVNVVILEAAILIEANWQDLTDEIWLAKANQEVVIERVQLRNNFTREEIIKRIQSQMSNDEREKHADVVIDNDGTIEQLHEKVKTLWHSRVNGRVT
ncbi:MAG: dephospho-CoA kinase [SAR202 cluster bacterium]|nr:dephospho-CoA kinase [Chloroflexota bacterium]MQG50554.1 dephospho-CoA kinase [SAR202 cluster bacterium]|tara:strand:- start:2611 stop:3216 length:606 start_codon:yes stop_codon:yes gene_type:complete